ncbi:MAG: YgjV family protein [Clostridia bacterium]|nr:YgjV family protein [Clostridia bacterium]
MNWYDLIAQAIGFIGVALNIVAFQCKKHKNVMIFKSSNELAFAAQYIMLGAYTGAALNGVSIVRNLLFARLVEKKKPTLVYQIVFALFFVVVGIFTWKGPLDALVILAKPLSTFSYGLSDTAKVRLLSLPVSVSWLVYNYTAGSVAGIICEAFTLVSLITAIIRIDLPKYREKNRETGEHNPD